MKMTLIAAVFGLLFSALNARADLWQTNYEKALKSAAADKKMVLLDFTGSDWCVVCREIDKEIFSKPEFLDYASKNLVLVKLDYPQLTPLSEELMKQNVALAREYGVAEFPTIIVLNSEGKMVGNLGYSEQGPSKFVSEIKALSKS